MKITDIDIIPAHVPLAVRNAAHAVRFRSIDQRTFFKVQTDNGLVGWGEYRCTPPPLSSVEGMIGCSPFDFLTNDVHLGLAGALYDVMGKYLEVPAYKLMGPKVRDRVPVAAWTRPAAPEELSREIVRAADQGYRLFKMHTCQYHDVFEQNRAVEDVAPEGFKMQYDFNSNRTLATVLPIVKKLEKSPVVGYIEDPLVLSDVDGWCRLRAQSEVPLIMHVPPLGGLQEVIQGMADAYIVAEYCGGFGDALVRGLAYGKANLQVIVQLTGGTLAKALALHLAAVLPTAAHTINLDDQYEEDAALQRIEIVEGCSPVPQGPGLGVEVDEAIIKRLAAQGPAEMPRHLGKLRLPAGHVLYSASIPAVDQLTGFAEGTVRGLSFEIWHDDGSEEFERMYGRVQTEATVLE
jgi:L-alanine-DL-glutamate epimerase-like enolase superfamily enzyme